MSLNFLTLYGSVRTERQGIKFARFLDTQLRKRGHASTLIDPLQYRVPLLDKMYKEYPKGGGSRAARRHGGPHSRSRWLPCGQW
jgi:NAD(P)H-dependent FMN reductase